MITQPSWEPSGNPVGIFQTRVEWIDTDAAGIYHNSTVTRFVEAAEATLMRERGLSDYFPVAPRVRYEVEFEAPLFFGQDVITTVELTKLGTSSMTFAFEVWGEAFRDLPRHRAAHGSYVTVHVNRRHEEGGAGGTPWPRSWVEALGGGFDASG